MTVSTPLAAVLGSDHTVRCSDGTVRRTIDLDYAASAPALAAVVDRVQEVVPFSASVHRGSGHKSAVCTEAYEAARRTVHAFCGADDEDVVVFGRNTTDALNLLAHCVPGDVVVLDVEHHANLLPWRRRRVVRTEGTIAATLARLEAVLSAKPAALLAVTGASNVTGEVLPIAELAALAHRHGARILVDGAQLVPHRRVDITAAGVDYLAFSGHKLYAPFGAGVLVGRRDWLDAADPYLAGGGATSGVSVLTDGDVDVRWHPAPARHEGGTPNLLGAVALAAACEEIARLDPVAVAAHDRAATDAVVRGLTRTGGVRVLRVWDDSDDVVGIVSFTVDGVDPVVVADALARDHAVAVRAGKFCAHPLLARLGADDGAVRVSVGLGTTAADVEALLDALTVTCLSLRDGVAA